MMASYPWSFLLIGIAGLMGFWSVLGRVRDFERILMGEWGEELDLE